MSACDRRLRKRALEFRQTRPVPGKQLVEGDFLRLTAQAVSDQLHFIIQMVKKRPDQARCMVKFHQTRIEEKRIDALLSLSPLRCLLSFSEIKWFSVISSPGGACVVCYNRYPVPRLSVDTCTLCDPGSDNVRVNEFLPSGALVKTNTIYKVGHI